MVGAEVVVQVKKECKVFEKILVRAGRTFSVFGCEVSLQTPSLSPPAGPSTTAEQNVPSHTQTLCAHTYTHFAKGAVNRLRCETGSGEFSHCVKLVSLVCDWQII